jgi:hypothetical protein
MAKASVAPFHDSDATANEAEVIYYHRVYFSGPDVPGGVLVDNGPTGNGLPIGPVNLDNVSNANYGNLVGSTVRARAVALGLGFTVPANRVFYHQLTRA